MGGGHARVVAPPPATSNGQAWDAAPVGPPVLGGGAGATFTQWDATASAKSGDALLLGCVETPIPGWVEDMRQAVQARTRTLASTSLERIVGVPVDTRDADGHFDIRYAGGPEDAPRVGIARTFIGWSEGAVVTCFAACATPKRVARADIGRACDASVAGARLEGGSAAPAPGLVLGAVTWGVHHPGATVMWCSVLAFALAVLAVVFRRKPRCRI